MKQNIWTKSHFNSLILFIKQQKNNAAILKCNIPSFVSDHVEIIEWVDTNGGIYTRDDNSGKLHNSLNVIIGLFWDIAMKLFGFCAPRRIVHFFLQITPLRIVSIMIKQREIWKLFFYAATIEKRNEYEREVKLVNSIRWIVVISLDLNQKSLFVGDFFSTILFHITTHHLKRSNFLSLSHFTLMSLSLFLCAFRLQWYHKVIRLM